MSSLAPQRLPPGERLLVAGLFVALLGIRLLHVRRLAFDTDEAQHLHVAWAWTQGHVQYRDVFDNHTPLFHLLAAPFLLAVGERPDVQVLARYAMIPLFAATLWLTGF